MGVLGDLNWYCIPVVGFSYHPRMVCDSTMVNFNTLGDILLRRYITDFVAQMQGLGTLYSSLNPKKVRYVGKGREKTAELLFREKKWDKWALWKPQEGENTDYSSVLGHQCKRFHKVSLMSIHPRHGETCYICGAPMPENLVGLWKMQNWDVYIQLIGEVND